MVGLSRCRRLEPPKTRQDFGTQRRPQASDVLIGAVLDPSDAVPRQEIDCIGVWHRQHGPHERDALRQSPRRPNPRHALGSRPSEQPHQERFELVVGMMPSDHRPETSAFGDPSQFSIAGTARVRLRVPGHRRCSDRRTSKGTPKPLRKAFGLSLVGGRFRRFSEIMAHVGNHDRGVHRCERRGERGRIGPAGAGYERPAVGVANRTAACIRSPRPDDATRERVLAARSRRIGPATAGRFRARGDAWGGVLRVHRPIVVVCAILARAGGAGREVDR